MHSTDSHFQLDPALSRKGDHVFSVYTAIPSQVYIHVNLSIVWRDTNMLIDIFFVSQRPPRAPCAQQQRNEYRNYKEHCKQRSAAYKQMSQSGQQDGPGIKGLALKAGDLCGRKNWSHKVPSNVCKHIPWHMWPHTNQINKHKNIFYFVYEMRNKRFNTLL